MAKLDLGYYELELVLNEIVDIGHGNAFMYHVTLTCQGVNMFAPWRKLALGEEWNTLFMPTEVPFDEHFRPILSEEWPIKLTDEEGGNFMTVIAYPSSFLAMVEQGPWISPWEIRLLDLADAANDRCEDKKNERERNKKPKKFHLERDAQVEKVRFSFQISRPTMGIPPGNYEYKDGWGHMAFDAYVDYDALERFLDELKAERKALVAKYKAAERRSRRRQ